MAKPADFVVDNASGSAVRTDLNNIFDAISINNGFSSGAPTQKYKYMWYADEASSGKMSFYKANATDKLEFISLTDGSFFGPNGSSSSPSYTFSNSTSTGFYRSASNEIGVSNNGTNTPLFKTSGTDIKGVLSVIPPSGEAFIEVKTNGINNEDAYIDFVADTTYTDHGLRLLRGATGANSVSQLVHRGLGGLELMAQDGGTIDFKLGVETSSTNIVRWKFNGAGGFVWAEHIGTNNSTSDILSIASGIILPKGIVSKTGSNAAAAINNVYNFYWTNSALQCWIGEVNVGTVTITSSDYRIKQNITTQTASGIDKIKQLRPVNYKYKDYSVFKADGVDREGFIAHEVQEVIPSGVEGSKDGEAIQSLNMDAIVSVLTKALQEAVAKIETLETKVAALEAG